MKKVVIISSAVILFLLLLSIAVAGKNGHSVGSFSFPESVPSAKVNRVNLEAFSGIYGFSFYEENNKLILEKTQYFYPYLKQQYTFSIDNLRSVSYRIETAFSSFEDLENDYLTTPHKHIKDSLVGFLANQK
jgi:hypothetical protein